MGERKGWFTPHGGESERAFSSVEGQRQTLRSKGKLPPACPYCGWKGEFAWDGGNYVTCGYCISKVAFEKEPMRIVRCPLCGYDTGQQPRHAAGCTLGGTGLPMLEEKEMGYCPECQCMVETEQETGGRRICVRCGAWIETPGVGQVAPPPDGTMFQVNKEGIVGMMGWICPVCGQGISPLENVCPCKTGITITGTYTPDPIWPPPDTTDGKP